jgi:hypothetical protein
MIERRNRMSEIEARKYTSVRMLKEEIRQNMKDYELVRNIGTYMEFNDLISECEIEFYRKYLLEEVNKNIKRLKELVEQEND